MAETNGDSWLKWSKYVLKELERLDGAIKSLDDNIRKNADKVTSLQIKIAAISSVAAILTSVATSIIVWLLTK